jgi:hypothetical protein
MHTSHGQPRLALLLLAIVGVLAYCGAATTGARSATTSLTFANCSASVVAYSFTLGGSGFAPATQLEVTVQDNIFPGQFDQPFFPVTDATGSFSIAVSTGSTQVLPATVNVYTPGSAISLATATLTPDMLGSGCPYAIGGSGPVGGPRTVDDCKYGNQTDTGWKQWSGVPLSFRSQGDCVSWVPRLGK